MSIPILNQVYGEARRLAVAGSAVARGDFRLKKLLPQLDQAGAKVPVFARVAECARAVIDGPDEKSAENLLELTSLVTAVLSTQGEAGVAGRLEPIETIDLGGAPVQTSARLLKPLLEALTSTGSGRLELIRDAQQRGAFRDLRLVKPVLGGLDDSYGEIADFLADHVLPIYGRAILPELRAKFDPKGGSGHSRRLRLMHALDPAGTRELVTAALDGGSKEVRVAAVACLGASPGDLSILIEQASAKAQDVRRAAYQALATIDDPMALAVLETAIQGKDADIATSAIGRSRNDALTALLTAEIRSTWAGLSKLKDKKQIGSAAARACKLIHALPNYEHATADALTLDLFVRRNELAKTKGDQLSGSDVVEVVIRRMAFGPMPLRLALARAHADLDADGLSLAVQAARVALPPAEMFEQYSPYLASGAKKKGSDAEKREAVIEMFGGEHIHRSVKYQRDDQQQLDPRWLELAVGMKHLGLVNAVGRPGNPAAEAFVSGEFDSALKKSKSPNDLSQVVTVMVRLRHPRAAEALIAAYQKSIGQPYVYYWYLPLVQDLPKSAIPQLEAVVPKLKGREADQWVAAIEELRGKG